jgi:hypothetical protein
MSRYLVLAVIGSVAVGCGDRPAEPTDPLTVPAFRHGSAASANANGANFGTPLSSDEEVPPNASRAVGNAIFQLNAGGTELSYKLIVANIENAFMAHIHSGPAGANGPIVVWLYPSTTPGETEPFGGGRIQGVIAKGTIVEGDLVGPLAGGELSDLIELIESGGAYVNVHTNDGVGDPNTGPGDFPGGEIRGQVEHRGH